MASTTQSLTFHLFPLLPKELRLQIWTHALPPPQVLDLALTHRERGDEGRILNRGWVALCNWTTKTPPEHSQLPYVNQEARQVFLDSHVQTSISDQAIPSLGRHVWIDYSRDTLYFTKRNGTNLSRWFAGQFEQGGPHPPPKALLLEFSKVHHIAIDWPSLGFFHRESHPPPWTNSIVARIRQLCHYCPELEELSLVIDARDLDLIRKEEFTTVDDRAPIVRGKGQLVDATMQTCNQGGVIVRGEAMLEPSVLEPLAGALKERSPDLNLPTLRLKLFIGDRPPEKLRKWDLYAGTCSVDDTKESGNVRNIQLH
ncbi:hypothetical protein N431DRAFT_429311 [Stipitochalara longipes BDJ]|nr:hypothetical protein N431DRAFT_429311 [Stipitochalara longipes BDJ]